MRRLQAIAFQSRRRRTKNDCDPFPAAGVASIVLFILFVASVDCVAAYSWQSHDSGRMRLNPGNRNQIGLKPINSEDVEESFRKKDATSSCSQSLGAVGKPIATNVVLYEALSRRRVLSAIAASGFAYSTLALNPLPIYAQGDDIAPEGSAAPFNSVYKPAKRPLAYRVDSTIPPTLLPLNTADQQNRILGDLGRGSGTDKDAIAIDTINLNNMLNKAVFGTANAVQTAAGNIWGGSNANTNPATFVCLGMPTAATFVDVKLAQSVTSNILQYRNPKTAATALALSFCPYSTQDALDRFMKGACSDQDLQQALRQAGVSQATIELYWPLLEFSKSSRTSTTTLPPLDLLAIAPETEDRETALANGLQNVNARRRSQYVVDPEGFIAQPQDPRFKLYADRSLMKDLPPASKTSSNNDDNFRLVSDSSNADAAISAANFFAERIMVHEAAATAMAQYVVSHPVESKPLVVAIAPTPDVRFLNGMNGRLARVAQHLVNQEGRQRCVFNNNAVTTILINPTTTDTLSRTRWLRLEIGTGPDTLDYQTKVADYLWFSSMPKVNMLPRLMNGF